MLNEFTPNEFTPRVIVDLGIFTQSNKPKIVGSISGALTLEDDFESELDLLPLSVSMGNTCFPSTASPLAVHATSVMNANGMQSDIRYFKRITSSMFRN